MAKTNSSPKRKTPPSPQPSPLGDNAQAFGQAVGDAFKSMAGMSLPLQDLTRLQQHYLQEMTQLWNQALGASEQPAPLKDRRFSAQAWAQNPMAAFTARAYLLNARTLMEMAEAVEGDNAGALVAETLGWLPAELHAPWRRQWLNFFGW